MKRVVLCIAVVASLAVAGSVRADDTPPAEATIAVGVTIGSVDVGGMTVTAAATAVQDAFNQPLELLVAGTRVLVTPDVVGATAGVQKAVEKAQAATSPVEVPLPVTVDRSATTSFVAKLAKRFDRGAADSKLFLRGGRPFLTKERRGRKLDQASSTRVIVQALTSGVRDARTLPLRLQRAAVTRANFGPVIVIHRGLNRLYLYNGMRYWRVFAVATGQTQYPTPLGRFRIVVKWKNPWWYPPASPWAQGAKPVPPGPNNPLGTRWMGLSAPGVGIHGTPSDGSIGYSLSHGCIRMHIPEAEWLFNHVDLGTTVFIVPH
ncbi:MAG: L,D-transpeptidase family protein [Gaiellaceae bacterium]